MTEFADRFFAEMKADTAQQKGEAVLSLFEDLSKAEKDVVARKVTLALGSPGDATRDRIWLVIVWAFAIVLLGSAATLAVAVFLETKANAVYFAKVETMVTVFTSVLAFLSGLLAPSPIK
jgi:hypothetical protein